MPKGRGVLGRLAGLLQLPREVLPYGFGAVLSGQEELLVRGCKKILTYDAECITLALPHTRLSVYGEGLFCSAFGGGSVTLGGHIRKIELGE